MGLSYFSAAVGDVGRIQTESKYKGTPQSSHAEAVRDCTWKCMLPAYSYHRTAGDSQEVYSCKAGFIYISTDN